jgi:VanZ family protein
MGGPTRKGRSSSGRCWLLRALLFVYLGLLAYLSLRAVGDTTFDRAVGVVGRGYLHLPAYAGLAILLSFFSWSRRGASPFLIATAYGWALEAMQIVVPTRTFNLLGLGLDAGGALVGWLVGRLVARSRAG